MTPEPTPASETPRTDHRGDGAPDVDALIACYHAHGQTLERELTAANQRIAELEGWKESALSVMPDMQAIGKAIGVRLGESVHDKILPALAAVTKERDEAKAERSEALANLAHADEKITELQSFITTARKETP